MDGLIEFIMGSSTSLDIYVVIRLAIIFALINMLERVVSELIRGAQP